MLSRAAPTTSPTSRSTRAGASRLSIAGRTSLGAAATGRRHTRCSSPWPTRSSAAFCMDLDVRRYATFHALRGYTARSADPVGRLLLALFGYRQAELVRYADEISTALQLTNFWQDVAADAARDHIYIP